jgi:hypothetical protein
MDFADELQRIYDSEINVEIGWLWDGGIDVRLGDKMNGYEAEENVRSVAEVIPWLQEAIAHFYPKSTYALSLDAELRERAARRLFRPPRIGARVTCPHCGAPHAAPEFDELLAFTCAHCGNFVEVERPKIQ